MTVNARQSFSCYHRLPRTLDFHHSNDNDEYDEMMMTSHVMASGNYECKDTRFVLVASTFDPEPPDDRAIHFSDPPGRIRRQLEW